MFEAVEVKPGWSCRNACSATSYDIEVYETDKHGTFILAKQLSCLLLIVESIVKMNTETRRRSSYVCYDMASRISSTISKTIKPIQNWAWQGLGFSLDLSYSTILYKISQILRSSAG